MCQVVFVRIDRQNLGKHTCVSLCMYVYVSFFRLPTLQLNT